MCIAVTEVVQCTVEVLGSCILMEIPCPCPLITIPHVDNWCVPASTSPLFLLSLNVHAHAGFDKLIPEGAMCSGSITHAQVHT